MKLRPLHDRLVVERLEERGAVVAEKMRASNNPNYGFNADTEKYEDPVKAGVIDPAKVTRTALQNATSIAARSESS